MKNFSFAVLFFFSFLLASFAQQTPNTVTEAQAIEIAKEYAITEGKVPAEWFGGYIAAFKQDNEWLIHFDSKPDKDGSIMIGNEFVIVVSNEGKVLYVIPGQ